ncbi:SDR family NAD(P)-dependent oxidoreductase [Pseudomonas putida]
MLGAFDSLAGQVAVVTGAGRGLGEVTAQQLAAAEMIVVLTGRCEQTLDAAVQNIRAQGLPAYFCARGKPWA